MRLLCLKFNDHWNKFPIAVQQPPINMISLNKDNLEACLNNIVKPVAAALTPKQ